MTRVGQVWLAEGLVLAVEPGGDKGTRVTVELDEQVRTKVHGDATPRFVQRTIYVTPARWAALVAERGGVDMLLAHRITLSELEGATAPHCPIPIVTEDGEACPICRKPAEFNETFQRHLHDECVGEYLFGE